MAVVIRACQPRDLQHVQAIYAHHVLHGAGSFEETPPTVQEIRARYERIVAGGYPYLVAERDALPAGFAYACEYRPRTGYRFTCESSVYIAPDAQRAGIGRALMQEVIASCERLGLRQMLAVIGDSGNVPSIRLHLALGFRQVGTFVEVGFKFGGWLDTVLMQRALGSVSGKFL
jgi:L-amino acid N-acyltransferase YncA